MSHVIHRNLKSVPKQLAQARGMYVTDSAGKTYLDGTAGGVAVACLGHGNAEVEASIARQLRDCAYIHSSMFTTEAVELLADFLAERAPADLSAVCFVNGGSEATDTALKMVRQYFLEIGAAERTLIISRQQSYHGNTIGALAASGNVKRREMYQPYLFQSQFIDPCYAYRHQVSSESELNYGKRAAAALEDAILEAGPERVAAFIAEPVVGATLGCVPAVAGYLRRVREICDKYGVLLILDEIMCGMGRTGTLFSCEEDAVVPDILLSAKGLGGGFQPIGAVLARQHIVDAMAAGTGALMHGHTYMGHAVACAAALSVQTIIERDGLLAKVTARGELLRERLVEALGQHQLVGDIRGRGLFIGIEFVADKATKVALRPELLFHQHLKARAFDRGLLCYPGGGTVDGQQGDHVLLAPAFIIEPNHIDELVHKLALSIDDAARTTGIY